MIQVEPEVLRLLPSAELPKYTYYPGSGVPHPVRDPRGHSHNRRVPTPPALDHETWAENRCYLWALDLFNNGFYWEAHEEWERLWRATGAESDTGKFLKGMIKLAAAGIKVREKSLHGVRRHAASAGEVFADVAADVGVDFYCGLELTNLQYAADRAAQLSYKQPFVAGKPVRVFPFVLTPNPLPLE